MPVVGGGGNRHGIGLSACNGIVSAVAGDRRRRGCRQRLVSAAPASLRLTANLKCAMLAALVWCIYFYFARHSSYAGDDFGLIRAVLQGGLRQSLHLNIRPLEYFFDKL